MGLPNVGKSSTYNIISRLNVPAENYPFCTIEPNEAKVRVRDERFDQLCEIYKPKKNVSSYLDITDIAGLVKGASKGEGMGNAFLSNINNVDGIYHVVRAFDDKEVTHEEGSVDPIRDIETINTELILKDMQVVEKLKDAVNLKVKGKSKEERLLYES